MTPRERRLKRKKALAQYKKTAVDHARSFVQSTNKRVAKIFSSKPTKGRAVRGKTRRSAPKAPTLPKSKAMLAAEKRSAALKKKAAAESAASRKRLAAIRAGKNPKFPTTTTKPAAKKTPAKKTPTRKVGSPTVTSSTPTVRKFNAGKSTTPQRGRTFAEPPKAKAKAPVAKAKPAAKPKAKPSTSTVKKTASTYKDHGSNLHVGRYKTLAEHRAAVAARKKKQQNS